MNWLELKNINVIKNNNLILNNINLQLDYEGITTILGPNGSGKTTLLNLIYRNVYPLIRNDSYIKIFGMENINIWDIRKKISIVNTDIHNRIKTNLTVYEVILSALFGGIGVNINNNVKPIHKELTDQIIDDLKIKDIANSKYSILSDGQKRITLIARSLINKPEILILDEPTINLDLKSYFLLKESIENISKNDITILFITNNLETILKDTRRVIFMKNGKIIANDNPDKLLNSEQINKLFDTDLIIEKIYDTWKIFN